MICQYATSSSPSDNPHPPTHETCIENIVVGLFTHVAHQEEKRRLNHTSRCGVRGVKVLPGFRPRENHTSTHSGPAHSSFTHHLPAALQSGDIDLRDVPSEYLEDPSTSFSSPDVIQWIHRQQRVENANSARPGSHASMPQDDMPNAAKREKGAICSTGSEVDQPDRAISARESRCIARPMIKGLASDASLAGWSVLSIDSILVLSLIALHLQHRLTRFANAMTEWLCHLYSTSPTIIRTI
jgi:hypothetical protein